MSQAASASPARVNRHRDVRPAGCLHFLKSLLSLGAASRKGGVRDEKGRSEANKASRKALHDSRRSSVAAVVRESLIRAGVLSSQYRFKTLSLDPYGAAFIALVDLTAEAAVVDDEMLMYWERWICQSAKTAHGIEVRSVYWRRDLHGDLDSVRAKRSGTPARTTGFGGLSHTDFGELPET